MEATINIYDRLFKVAEPGKSQDLLSEVNESSLEIKSAKVEPYLASAKEGDHFQFQRSGYFVRTNNKKTLEFNKTVGLREGWKK